MTTATVATDQETANDTAIVAHPSTTDGIEMEELSSSGEDETDGEKKESDEDTKNSKPPSTIRLYKSSRLNGYLTLFLASAINFNESAYSVNVILVSAVKAANNQREYAVTVSMVTLILAGIIVLAHLDRVSPLRKFWETAFKPKSRIELALISFFVLWWGVATWVQTTVRGISGDGKGQYNHYFSTWSCLLASIWTLEKWMVACGHASFKEFLAAWPNRAPGWIVLFVLSFFGLFCILDLYLYWEVAGNDSLFDQFNAIAEEQWTWLLFVNACTVPFSLCFVLVEIFRETKPGEEKHTKSEWETILEGFVLLLLVLAWIPTVILATTPGGIASLVGNSYFFTWATTVFVLETGIWWIHDWRKRIHFILQQQEREYETIKAQVLEKTRQQQRALQEAAPSSPKHKNQGETDEDDETSVYSDNMTPAIPDVVGV